MSFRQLLFGESETRQHGYHPSAEPPQWMMVQPGADAGVVVDSNSIQGLSGIYAGINRIAEYLAGLPIEVVRENEKDDTTQVLRDHKLRKILKQPNPWMTRFSFIELCQWNVMTTGNQVCKIDWSKGTGEVTGIYPLSPERVQILQNQEGLPIYKYSPPSGPGTVFDQADILHFKGPGDGYVGKSIAHRLPGVLGIHIAAQKNQAAMWKNNAIPSGILSYPKVLKADRIKEMKDQWQESYGGSHNAGHIAILEAGMEFQRVGFSPEETQALQLADLHIEDQARLIGIPPHMIGHLKRASFSNIEQQSREFLDYTTRPWKLRYQGEMSERLFRGTRDQDLEVVFIHNVLGNADILTRFRVYQIGIASRIYNANECRKFEGENPYEGGDVYENPNTTSGKQSTVEDGDKKKEDDEENSAKKIAEEKRGLFLPLFAEVVERSARKESKRVQRLVRQKADVREFFDMYSKLETELADNLELITQGYAIELSKGKISEEEVRTILESVVNHYAQGRTRQVSRMSANEIEAFAAEIPASAVAELGEELVSEIEENIFTLEGLNNAS